ncbi:ribosome hibernation-promoting factor, HPF/YfiA family [Afifella sp. IM 167]|uniref:ribosome hibernation-promoting factor, HPF/YfiA family n=1 Tax=Afifella sp. IM 167 TaxID=2033586 RepID=UPI001CC9F855|nr:ribosome-associated translation inhibitor RaiA [Afifella sp. IM 167]MBZ8135001.1 ribosomal subunit interface protein [Afifella sp. IM 167]
MALKISGKNVDIGEALRSRIEATVEGAVTKYFDGGYSGHVTVCKNARNFHTECAVHLDTGVVLEAGATNPDANGSFDEAAERLEKRLRRYKRRLKDHKRHVSPKQAAAEAAAFVIAPPHEEEEIGDEYAPAIVAETTTEIKRMTVSSAVLALDMTDAPVIVFRNHSHGGVNVVYRRPDGHFGWIDPALSDSSEEANG